MAAVGLPADLLEAADDVSLDAVIRGPNRGSVPPHRPDVGTPIITYLRSGNSLFGPVISEVPDDDRDVQLYDALRTFADFEGLSELKRSDRPPLDRSHLPVPVTTARHRSGGRRRRRCPAARRQNADDAPARRRLPAQVG